MSDTANLLTAPSLQSFGSADADGDGFGLVSEGCPVFLISVLLTVLVPKTPWLLR